MKQPKVWLLDDRLLFPPAHWAGEDGLLAIGGDLSPRRLLLAYRSGIFPWFRASEPILWYSPPERLVFLPDGFHVSRSLRKTMRRHERDGTLRITMNTAFEATMRGCASAPGRDPSRTWINPDMIAAYTELHHRGIGHSVEIWNESNALVGGVYGLAIGRVFFAESMFSLERDASKIALATLTNDLWGAGFQFLDAQMPTPHLLSLGGVVWDREEYLERLGKAIQGRTKKSIWE